MSALIPEFYNSVDLIEPEIWQALDCGDNVYYTPEFLKAFEAANRDIEFNYIIVFREKEPIAFANTQIVTIGIETITKNIKINPSIKNLINRIFKRRQLRILFCGNIFLSGEYGTFLRKGEDKIVAFNALARAVSQLARKTRKLHAIFVKDFKEESLYITDLLENFSYTAMHVEPNMIIHLDPSWQTFEDFKDDLKSKYRIKANKADSLSDELDIRVFNQEDISTFKDELQVLYENTIANANFNAQVLNLNTYSYLKTTYGEDFIVKGYFYQEQLVGFLSAMINGDHLDAHFIGLNYDINKQFAIYPRILNDYVRLGVQHKSKQINLGRTASEIKTTLGAVPEDLTCYIRHKRWLPNKIIQPFIKSVKIKTFRQHRPFKTKKEAFTAS